MKVILATFQRILVPVDGSQNSKRALETAIAMAKLTGASLFVLHVIPLPVYTEGGMMTFSKYIEAARAAGRGIIQDAADTAKQQAVTVRADISENSPSVIQAITEYADEWKVDLIIIGTRGLGGFKRLLLGSISDGVLKHAHCSVMVVR